MEAAAERRDDLACHRSELLRYVHRLTGDPDFAEDVVQDALLRYVTYEGADSLASPRAWLYRVATNLVRDNARNAAMRERRTLLVDLPSAPTPDQELERKQAADQVRRVLDRLPSRDRELLVLRESGFRYREIAEVVSVRTESVPTLMARAVKRFRASFIMEAGDDPSV